MAVRNFPKEILLEFVTGIKNGVKYHLKTTRGGGGGGGGKKSEPRNTFAPPDENLKEHKRYMLA